MRIKNILILKILIILQIFFAAQNVSASQLPRYLGSEKKFRSYVYNPNEVYRYLGHYMFQGFIEFEKGESISTITMGDPSQWLFEHLGNRLFLKPVGEGNSQTNMTVITGKRIYHFELTAKEARGIDDKDLIFVAKFVYPGDKDKNILQFPKALASDIPDLTNLSIYNFSYQYTGEPSIAPIKVFDNGQFTYFQFSRVNAEIPAIFSVDNSGFESLVNYRVAGDFVIVEKVGEQFTLRSGDDIVCVYNSSLFAKNAVDPYSKKDNKSPVRANSFAPPSGPIGSMRSPLAPNPMPIAPASNNFSYPNVTQTNPFAPNIPAFPNPGMGGYTAVPQPSLEENDIDPELTVTPGAF